MNHAPRTAQANPPPGASFARRLALLLPLLGCAGAPEETWRPSDLLVHEVRFEGVTRFGKDELLRHLHLGETGRLPMSPDHPFDEALLAVDRGRIEALYRAHGYYQAKVADVLVAPAEDEGEVDVLVVVEEGEPTRVTALRFSWPEDPELGAELRAEVEAEVSLAVGEPFSVPALNDSLGAVRLALQRRGFPLARSRGAADVREGLRTAIVELSVAPGPHARIGRVLFDGLALVPRYLLEREVRFALDQPFSPALVSQVERAVKSLRVFRWVSAQATDEVAAGRVDLRVRVSEADPHRVRLGVELNFEAVRWQQRAVGTYTNTNLFGHLTRLDLAVVGGWAELPDPFSPALHGPVTSLAPRLTKKGLLEDHLTWTLEPEIGTDVQEGYQYWSPSNRLAVARWLVGRLRTSLSHTVRYMDFFNVSPELDANASLLGRDFRDPFVLSYGELSADLFLTDSIAQPTRGVVFELLYDLAGSLFSGDYTFHKLAGGVRAYAQPWPDLQFAARLLTGTIVPFGAGAGVPFALKFYLGGANSVRGWGSRRLSPKLTECDDTDACDQVPVGGNTMVQGNLELRWRAVGDLSLVGFVDLGDVQEADRTWVPSEWSYSAGPGARYDSPVGLFRLDLGLRLNDTGVHPGEPMWAVYFGLGETF